MTLAEIKAQINKEFSDVMSHPDLDFVDRIHARSVRNWSLLAAPKIAEAQAANPVVVGADATAPVASTASFMTTVFDVLKTIFAANPIILAIVMGVEGIYNLLHTLLSKSAS